MTAVLDKDQSFTNLNVTGTLGECKTRIRARCATVGDLTADRITATTVRAINVSGVDVTLPLNFPFTIARVQLAQTQNIAAPVVNPLIFDTVVEDNEGIYDPGTGFFTIPRDGLYAVEVSVLANNFGILPTVVFGVVTGSNVPITITTAKAVHTVETEPGASGESEYLYYEQNYSAGDTFAFAPVIGGPVGNTMDVLGTVATGGVRATYGSVRRIL